MQADLVVIGAGLAGSCLAAAVAQQGWKVVLIERRPRAQHKVCGEFLSPEVQTSLRGLGLYHTVAALAPAPMSGATLISRRGISLRVGLPGTAWGVSRFALDSALSDGAVAAGTTLLGGATATAVTPTSDGYTVELRDAAGERVQVAARTAVIACGRHAAPGLRAQTANATPRQLYVGVKCHYEGVSLAPEVRLYLFDGGYVGLSPIEHGRANLCLLATQEAFQRAGKTIPGMLAAIMQGNPALARDLVGGQVLGESMVAVAAVDTERPAALWGPCARIGDAATMIPPLCGDGMAMAIRAAEISAPLVGEVLAGKRSLEEWQAAYEASWHREFDGPLRAGRRLQALLGTPGLSAGLLGLGRLLPRLAQRLVLATRGQPSEAVDELSVA